MGDVGSSGTAYRTPPAAAPDRIDRRLAPAAARARVVRMGGADDGGRCKPCPSLAWPREMAKRKGKKCGRGPSCPAISPRGRGGLSASRCRGWRFAIASSRRVAAAREEARQVAGIDAALGEFRVGQHGLVEGEVGRDSLDAGGGERRAQAG